MKGKEGTRDPGGPDAKSGRYSSGSGLCPSRENGFFADVIESVELLNIINLGRGAYSSIQVDTIHDS